MALKMLSRSRRERRSPPTHAQHAAARQQLRLVHVRRLARVRVKRVVAGDLRAGAGGSGRHSLTGRQQARALRTLRCLNAKCVKRMRRDLR